MKKQWENEPTSNQEFAKRIKGLLGDMNPHAFAEKCGISYSTLLRMIRGQTIPRGDTLQLIAEATNLTVDWLLYGREKPKVKPEAMEVEFLEVLGESVEIPLIDLYVGAGNGYEVQSEEVQEYLTLPLRLVATERGLNAKNLQAVTVKGDSMIPDFNSGDIVVLDLSQNQPAEGVYVVRLENTVVLKRLQRIMGNQLKLSSQNPLYEPIIIDLKTSETTVPVIGRVVWSLRRF